MLPLDARGLPAENKTRYHCKESGHLAFCGFEFITFQKPEIPSSTFQFYQIAFLSCFKKRTKKTGTRNSYCIVFRLWRNDFLLPFVLFWFSIMKPMQEISAHLVFCLPISRRLSEYL